MTEQTISERVENVLREHDHLGCVCNPEGWAWRCECGERIAEVATIGSTLLSPPSDAYEAHRAHVAEQIAAALAPVVAEAKAEAWGEGYEKRAATLGMTADPNPYRAEQIGQRG